MRYPYEIFESIYGPFDPLHPHTKTFTAWFNDQKTLWLAMNPKARVNAYGVLYEADLIKLYEWLDRRYPATEY